MEIRGAIQAKESKNGTSPAGKSWNRWCFTINNKKYSTFDANIGEKFNIGDSVVITGSVNDKGYFDMKTMNFSDDKGQATLTKSAPVKQEIGQESQILDLLRQILAELKNINGDREQQKI